MHNKLISFDTLMAPVVIHLLRMLSVVKNTNVEEFIKLPINVLLVK